jgi:hypothetical protein
MSSYFRLKRQIEQNRQQFAYRRGPPIPTFGGVGSSTAAYDKHEKEQRMARFQKKKREKKQQKKAPLQTVDKESQLYGVKMSSERKREKRKEKRERKKSGPDAPFITPTTDKTSFVSEVTHKQKQEDDDDDEGEEEAKDKRLVWEPESILGSMENPQSDAFDLMKVISSIQGKDLPDDDQEYVWDRREDKGKESERNFFIWLEGFSAHQSELQKAKEEGIFLQ